jgi:hypothetical protein
MSGVVVRSPARYASGQMRAASTLHPTIEEDAHPYHNVAVMFLRQAMQKLRSTFLLLLFMSTLQIPLPLPRQQMML